jgi:hypothetical protein
MMEAVRTSETSVDNHFTRQYNPEDSSEHHSLNKYSFYIAVSSALTCPTQLLLAALLPVLHPSRTNISTSAVKNIALFVAIQCFT